MKRGTSIDLSVWITKLKNKRLQYKMNNKMTLDGEFTKALPVLNDIIEAGYEAYFVGGSVRDRILELDVNDVDIATSAQPLEIKKIFKRTVDVGIEHGTIMVLVGDDRYEITTFRTESTYKDFRRPDSVTFVRSLEEDLKRRDFTMNAIALDSKGNIMDPFHGMADIDKSIIRAVGNPHERFQEDALRMMRAVRFSAQLDFGIEAETMLSIRENAFLLDKIAVERIQIEFEKLLIGQWHTIGLAAMLKTDLYTYCPELADKKEALMLLIDDELPFQTARQAWAFLLYQIDATRDSHFKPRSFLKSWKLSNQMIDDAVTIFNSLKTRLEFDKIDPWVVFTIGRDMAFEVEHLVEHVGQTAEYEALFDIYTGLPIKDKKDLNVTGHDLMTLTSDRPGKWMSVALNEALRAVIYERLKNDKEEIIKWVKVRKLIPGLEEHKE